MSSKIIRVMTGAVMGVVSFVVVKSITSSLITTEGMSGVGSVLINILPIVVVVAIAIGAFSMIGGIGGKGELESGSKKKQLEVKIERNGRKLILMLTKASNSIGDYINNLDAILGIKTVNDNKRTSTFHPLILQDNNMYINNYLYDWYLVDKHPEMPMFKIVGLHKENASKNAVYVAGNNDSKPYLYKIPNEYIEKQDNQWVETALTKV